MWLSPELHARLLKNPIYRYLYFNWRTCVYAMCHLRNRPVLKRLIQGRRVLIIGSGPSASELEGIPEDVLVFTCNAGPKLLIEKKLANEISLYLCNWLKIRKKGVEEFLPKTRIGVFVTDNVGYVRTNNALRTCCRKILPYDLQRNYYLKKIIAPEKFPNHKTPSVGIRLLQYALHFKAREIYLIGIDLTDGGYFWGGKNKQKHANIDLNFIKIVTKKFGHIYSLSKKSPLASHLPYKPFPVAVAGSSLVWPEEPTAQKLIQ